MKKRLLILIGFVMLLAVTAVAADKKFTLVIDAGHGGHDAGAIGAITKEKTINLNVALAFGALVERNCPDVKVIYTRKKDVFIPLHTRADIANRNKADLFISIHTNALPKGRISRGMETYTLGMHRAADNLEVAKRENEVILYEQDYKQRYQGFDPKSSESYIMFEFMQDHNMAQSVELAKFVQKRTCASAGRQNKGVKQAGFLVLRETSMPSCLIELGFISTPDEERFLNSASGVSSLGQGIYQAFLDYKRKHDGKVAVPIVDDQKKDEQKKDIQKKDDQKKADEKKDDSKKQKKSKVAQELKDAREGKEDIAALAAPVAPAVPSADSILNAVSKPEKPAEPVKPVTQDIPDSPEKPAKAEQPKQPAKQEQLKQPEKLIVSSSAPLFKVQILASSSALSAKASQLKGEKADYYQEGGMYKYTIGSSEDYSKISQLRKSLLSKFPQAFIIAFKNGQRMDVQAAIQEYRSNKNKK